ncbi:hypothetical protein LHYA1_G004557 [Lachnellula hyalina]|uniref:CMP/dCMP-type deaminase domain-containing protein n=1 Tax=Lachnellula hyalina TaxID=1316788 RepID=A0A8H8TZG0_9HELO|nr:uncharacterized protein LHYA1_G004557 [Lachnellula hyalina]TVY25792.1 hypothetical protein LHYA1_G004557 [Lachnellula hyalina]
MSPRNDTLLSQCLAQAELSPLHYRHGAIIVRGGKVIGQGFNSYRPGFDGGALKTGTLPFASLDGVAIAELKQRLKSKPDRKSKSTLDNQQDSGTFTPFESMGQGHNANTPLSLHSEMMAIQSALSLSSGALSSQTSARSAKYYQKPCFSLSGDSKNRRARARGLKAYAEAICTEATETVASSLFKSRVLNPVHLNQVSKENNDKSNNKEEDSGFQEAKEDVASNTWKTTEKHRMKKNEYKYYEDHHRTQPHYYHHTAQQKHYAHKRSSEPQSSKDLGENTASTGSQPSSQSETSSSDDNSSPKKVKIKVSGIYHLATYTNRNQPSRKSPPLPPKTEQILVTKKSTLNSKPSVAARTKDLRLKGSDLYEIAKYFPQSTTGPHIPSQIQLNLHPHPPNPPPTSLSLHDELSTLSRSPSPPSPPTEPPPPKPEIRASRPCYRCVSAMHAVGIKRVFWTNVDGEWEGAKVRNLIEALEGGGGEEASGEGAKVDKGIFVTKHEVLLLKRVMGF